jgi:hypothetical protein
MKHTITIRNKQKKIRKNNKKSKRVKSLNRKRVTFGRTHRRSTRRGSTRRGSKHRGSTRRRSKQKGGQGLGNGALVNPPALSANVTKAFENQQATQLRQNEINNMVGGAVNCCNTDNDYGYPCPDGKCGPIPQSASEITNGLIKQAAIITATGIANAEYDNLVSQSHIQN